MKDPTVFKADSKVNWNVQVTEGAYPTFDADANEHQHKMKIFKFLIHESNIRIVEATESLLKDQLLECFAAY